MLLFCLGKKIWPKLPAWAKKTVGVLGLLLVVCIVCGYVTIGVVAANKVAKTVDAKKSQQKTAQDLSELVKSFSSSSNGASRSEEGETEGIACFSNFSMPTPPAWPETDQELTPEPTTAQQPTAKAPVPIGFENDAEAIADFQTYYEWLKHAVNSNDLEKAMASKPRPTSSDTDIQLRILVMGMSLELEESRGTLTKEMLEDQLIQMDVLATPLLIVVGE